MATLTTPKWHTRYPDTVDAADVPLWMSRMALDLDDVAKDLTPNTLANRPPAGTSGQWFRATDSGQIFRDNGSAWELMAKGTDPPPDGSVTLPKMAAGVGSRLLNVQTMSGYAATQVAVDALPTTANIFHNGKGMVYLLTHSMRHISGSGTLTWDLQRDGVSIATFVYGAIAAGYVGLFARSFSGAAPSVGNHTYRVTVTATGSLVVSGDGHGRLDIFEQY